MAPRTPRDKKKAPDIREVARRAGVSISTVSRFLNKKPVRPDAEARIGSAINELGYSPNRIARSLKLKRTMTLGMVIPDITNPFFPEIVKGVEVAARERGFTMVFGNMGEDAALEWNQLETFRAMRCDGCVIIPAPTTSPADEAVRRSRMGEFGLPLCCVDRRPTWPCDAVISDNRHSGALAMAHLMRLGHTRIGLLTVALPVSTHADRVEAYRKALLDAGVTPDPALEAQASPTTADGFSAAMRLLSQSPRPTALFVTSNRLVVAAVSAIAAKGLRCPEDVAVVGYDTYEWQEAFRPRLTTVAQPVYLMGRRAAELLIARVTGERQGPPEEIVLGSQLVVRESCGIYAAKAPA